MAEQYSRPASGFRFKNGGMKTNAAPDALAPDKYQLLLNARSYSDDEIRCRPGMQLLFDTTSGQPIRNVASYAEGQGQIRYLATSGGNVYLDTGAVIESGVFDASEIQSMVPYRPNQSVVPWQYVGDRTAYRKYSFPNPTVSAAKAGIAEPQAPVDAVLTDALKWPLSLPLGPSGYATFGTGSGLTVGSRNSGVVSQAFTDPANSAMQYLQTSFGPVYQRNQHIAINSTGYEVLDVFQAGAAPLSIQGIHYYTGSTGRCVIVPNNLTVGPGNEYLPLYGVSAVASLRRGSIFLIGAEVCFVLGVSIGPNGQIAVEASTTLTHTTADTFLPLAGIAVYGLGAIPNGATITGPDHVFAVATGIGGIQLSGVGGFAGPLTIFQPDDYMHFSVNIDNLSNLTEMKILLDIGDGSFTQNFLFYAVRPSDIQAGIANTLTQLGVAQLFSQRETIEEENRATGAAASLPSSPGSSQWSEILVPISQLIRVGNTQGLTLGNLNSIQFLFNVTGTVNAKISSLGFRGGYQVDCGDTGAAYRYRIRPRSSMTGALGNPSPDMRYGVSPRRDQVMVNLPSGYDPQFDYWDIFRLGGVLTNWTFAGTTAVGSPFWTDIYDDQTIQNSQVLDFDNLEPWPSIDQPFTGNAVVVGTTAVVTPTGGTGNFIASYLPGNKVTIGQNVYTLWTRPTRIAFGPPSVWLFQFQENAGAVSSSVRIYEPAFANNNLPYIWGPSDQGGVVFGGGDALRPGTVSFTKNFNPDSVPDKYNVEVCSPSEPIIGGVCAIGLSFAFSSNRVFPLRPSFGEVNQWTPMPTFGPGLASSFGIATNGRTVWYVATDGIRELSSGGSASLTHEDLSNIFPRDGVPPVNVAILGVLSPPDFTQAALFRLAHANGYLYFDFAGFNGVFQTLVFDVARRAWGVDVTNPIAVVHANVIQPQTSTSAGSPVRPVQMLFGDGTGKVYEQAEGVGDPGGAITFRVVTAEFTGGEERAPKQWGDASVSILPSLNNAMTIHPISGGVDQAQTLSLQSGSRVSGIVACGNVNLFSLGLDISCPVSYTGGETAPTLYIWQPSYLPQPVVEEQRFTDWDDAGIEGNKLWQGFIMEAVTSGDKSLLIRDADANASHVYTPAPVNFPRQQEQAFSFNLPFVAHSVRIEPQDSVDWSIWKVRWVAVPYPEACETWQTEGMTHGLLGWQHIYLVNLAYIATQTVTLTLSTDQGPVPVLTFPATGTRIAPLKQIIKSPFNKFKVVSYQFSSSAPFYLWRDLCETWVKAWGSSGPYTRVNPFGGLSREAAEA